ncbi:unnamed protein product [Didymodactylos carnosus]|uniref:Uncharacterized protein n=1 Tax=Didymodactylos carnosus TaxID=1234261 RepID=A0A814IPQ7_9BILA|nr:unnamed protein product [Didymodactylos carnosus]CAF1024495.1 unnamed protein product [Didymodactylos carnosus]CAF3657365.1 unnamed protein product [Didymodactylos carnosus]CAF3795752.1 unnamed protein product [Didymodactylos carnosus]
MKSRVELGDVSFRDTTLPRTTVPRIQKATLPRTTEPRRLVYWKRKISEPALTSLVGLSFNLEPERNREYKFPLYHSET